MPKVNMGKVVPDFLVVTYPSRTPMIALAKPPTNGIISTGAKTKPSAARFITCTAKKPPNPEKTAWQNDNIPASPKSILYERQKIISAPSWERKDTDEALLNICGAIKSMSAKPHHTRNRDRFKSLGPIMRRRCVDRVELMSCFPRTHQPFWSEYED